MRELWDSPSPSDNPGEATDQAASTELVPADSSWDELAKTIEMQSAHADRTLSSEGIGNRNPETFPEFEPDGPQSDDTNARLEHLAEAYDRRTSLAVEPITKIEPVLGDNCNQVYRVELADGRLGYCKPERGEARDLRPGDVPPGTEWQREIFACEFDRAVGYNLVPDTVPRYELDSPLAGNASLQEAAPYDGKAYEAYSDLDRQRMAVLDYVLGNLDRHDNNYKSQSDGRPAAIDNGLTLPEMDTGTLRSHWITDSIGKPLDPEVTKPLRTLDVTAMTNEITFHGIAPAAAEGFKARLEEVRQGTITGEAWPGKILDPHTWQTIKSMQK